MRPGGRVIPVRMLEGASPRRIGEERPMSRSERLLYAANGDDLRVVDLGLTDGGHVEPPFVRTPQAAGAVVFHAGRALLLWRHRPVTDTWGWEIPLGEIGPDE